MTVILTYSVWMCQERRSTCDLGTCGDGGRTSRLDLKNTPLLVRVRKAKVTASPIYTHSEPLHRERMPYQSLRVRYWPSIKVGQI
jgi:hypothetical protein